MLENKNILLRPIENEDVEIIYRLENNTELWQYSYMSAPVSRYALLEYVKLEEFDIYQKKQFKFVIENKENRKILGQIDLYDFEVYHSRIAIGVTLLKKEQGKGYGTQAVGLAVDYCLNYLKINQIHCDISVSNKRSIKLFTNLGFTVSGRKKQWKQNRYGFEDVLFLQLLKKTKN